MNRQILYSNDYHDDWGVYVFSDTPAMDRPSTRDAPDPARVSAEALCGAPESEHGLASAASAHPAMTPALAANVKPAKRAYGRKTTKAPAGKPLPLNHPSDLDLFPAFMSRSALFSASRSENVETHSGPLEAAGEVFLTFNGPRLSMADKRAWEAVMRIAMRDRVNTEEPFLVKLAEVARLAGFGKCQSRTAWAAIERLARSHLDATVYGTKMAGWLLTSAVLKGRRASILIDPSLVGPAFSGTLLASRTGAVGDGVKSLLAQWLRDYFSTHKPPARPLTLDYLRELSGYVSRPKHFVPALEKAMAELAEKRADLIASWSIDKSLGNDNASDRWTLNVQRGSSMPVVKRRSKPAASMPPVAKPTPKRRGGPAL